MSRFVAYYRVSTRKQEVSGLGLEAQAARVAEYVARAGGEIVATFTETESGKRADNRPELAAALKLARKERATLVIATLDRLSRSVAFVASLMEARPRVPFKCADRPDADEMELHMYAVFGQHERKRIGERTRAGLAIKKAQGVKLGNPQQARINEELRARRQAFREAIAPKVRDMRGRGLTIQEMRDELNRRQIATMLGKRWHVATVHRLLQYIEKGAAA